jgi:hypothetical protein
MPAVPRLPATPTTTQSLLRWLAAWLAIALCVQAVSGGSLALLGTAHRHTSLQLDAKPMLMWRHANPLERHDAAAHTRAHQDAEPHAHPVGDPSVLAATSDATALLALAAFIAAAGRFDDTATGAPSHLHHVWLAAVAWTPTARALTPLRHPPRA